MYVAQLIHQYTVKIIYIYYTIQQIKNARFFSRQQALFIRNLKENLEDVEIVISFDFAENYAFVIQNSAQSFHWNNK